MSTINDKKAAVVTEEENSSASVDRIIKANNLDGAAKFLEDNRDLDVSHINITKLRHKIDFRVSSTSCNYWSKSNLMLSRSFL
jgi:hypothetical protein